MWKSYWGSKIYLSPTRFTWGKTTRRWLHRAVTNPIRKAVKPLWVSSKHHMRPVSFRGWRRRLATFFIINYKTRETEVWDRLVYSTVLSSSPSTRQWWQFLIKRRGCFMYCDGGNPYLHNNISITPRGRVSSGTSFPPDRKFREAHWCVHPERVTSSSWLYKPISVEKYYILLSLYGLRWCQVGSARRWVLPKKKQKRTTGSAEAGLRAGSRALEQLHCLGSWDTNGRKWLIRSPGLDDDCLQALVGGDGGRELQTISGGLLGRS